MEEMEVQNVQSPIIIDDDKSEHAINQAAVFVEDAAQYRSINHKVDSKSLWMYRWYYSKPVRWGHTFIIFLYLMLAFVEKPSSLTLSSDPRFRGKRPDPPCGVTESLEIIFLLCFVFDLVVKGHVLGRRQVIRNKWLLSYSVVLIISFIDVFISLSSGCNLILLDFEYDKTWKKTNSHLAVVNFFFILYYLIEQMVKLWAVGWQRYRSSLALEIVHVSLYGAPFQSSTSNQSEHNIKRIFNVPNMIRVINMLIIFRLLRIVPNIKSLSLIVETLIKLLKHLRPFGGIIVASYYVFAILGMMLFNKVTSPSAVGAKETRILTEECGSFDQLQYYANNFDDFGAALVVLWDLMVVNNWHVFLKEYAKVARSWSQLYFVAWYLISVILIINLFVALILEAFISQWEMKQQRIRQNDGARSLETEVTLHVGSRFHQLFSTNLVEPTEEELVFELSGHHHYAFDVQGNVENTANIPPYTDSKNGGQLGLRGWTGDENNRKRG
ncbi:Two pore calcium channel protein 2 [Stylophora pistillata]|uniref:Two pore calcium channel protein 2 n=1 Tax=Stylophora pistillata TaxID=50429 RepID=A0A2B4RPP0_STYPI|nr:Two pore calcium channel protein 2 [Stylophora pistillata]